MSDQIPIDLRCHTEYKRIIVIVPHGVYCHNRNKECPGMDAITHPGQALSAPTQIRQVHSSLDTGIAGDSSYPCMDRGGSGNQCCNPGLGSGLLGLSISVLGSR